MTLREAINIDEGTSREKKLIDPKEKSFLEQLRGNWGVITHDISAPTNGHRRLVNTRSTSGEWPMASGS